MSRGAFSTLPHSIHASVTLVNVCHGGTGRRPSGGDGDGDGDAMQVYTRLCSHSALLCVIPGKVQTSENQMEKLLHGVCFGCLATGATVCQWHAWKTRRPIRKLQRGSFLLEDWWQFSAPPLQNCARILGDTAPFCPGTVPLRGFVPLQNPFTSFQLDL